jgi:NTP pyrophosphatase (non-canonical NTP hydrolase)
MVEEIGELAKSDKRWRKERTTSSGDKLEEIADVFIVAMNLAIFSGYSYDDITLAISDKIKKNEARLLP